MVRMPFVCARTPRPRCGPSLDEIATGRAEERRVLKRQRCRQGNAFWVRVPLAAGGNWAHRCGRYAQQDLIADAFPLQGRGSRASTKLLASEAERGGQVEAALKISSVTNSGLFESIGRAHV